ncbi:MAG TPA: HEAT repeat domain-containing protein [Terriglobales bacterium]
MLIVFAAALQTSAPPTQSVQQLISELSSPDLSARYTAFEKLDAIPHIFEREDAAKVAVKLLMREDHLWDSIGVSTSSPDYDQDVAQTGRMGEDFGPYVGDVQAVVWKYAERTHDPVAIRQLLYGPNAPDSELETWIASQGSAIIPFLEAATASPATYVRANAVDDAGILLRLDTAQPGIYIQPVDRDSMRARARKIVTNALKDPKEYAREEALNHLYRLNGTGDRDLVSQAAANDPSPAVRKHAARLLAGLGEH